MIANVRRIVETNTPVIDQLGLNRHWRDLKMMRDPSLSFLRIIPTQHVVHNSERTQKLRSERPLHLLPVAVRTRRGEQCFGRCMYLFAKHAIADEAGKVKTPPCFLPRSKRHTGTTVTLVKRKRYGGRMPALSRNRMTQTARKVHKGAVGDRLSVQRDRAVRRRRWLMPAQATRARQALAVHHCGRSRRTTAAHGGRGRLRPRTRAGLSRPQSAGSGGWLSRS